MKPPQWTIRRSSIKTNDAQLRWDRAYQSLVQWSAAVRGEPSFSPFTQESRDESRLVCAGVYPTSSANPND